VFLQFHFDAESGWLSRDPATVDAYIADALCGFRCTNQLWVDLLDALSPLSTPATLARFPKDLPIYVIAGSTFNEIYAGYRLLTGATPMLPKAAYGYIQCKQRYSSQGEVLAVAQGYRERHLPADILVVDWFYYSKMGEMDFVPDKWPDPAAMNRQLHDMGFQTMISVWPRFAKGSRYYDFLMQKGWFEHLADGIPTDGLPYDRAGSDIDTTNPEAARWFWETIRDNILSKGFDSIWADETEPDLPPAGGYFSIGPGTRYFNVYPLFHTSAIYEGVRREGLRLSLTYILEPT